MNFLKFIIFFFVFPLSLTSAPCPQGEDSVDKFETRCICKANTFFPGGQECSGYSCFDASDVFCTGAGESPVDAAELFCSEELAKFKEGSPDWRVEYRGAKCDDSWIDERDFPVDGCHAGGSQIGPLNQSFRESIEIPGTSFKLTYNSAIVKHLGVNSSNLAYGVKHLLGMWSISPYHSIDGRGESIKKGTGSIRIPYVFPSKDYNTNLIWYLNEEGTELYRFDSNKRHLDTLDPVSGRPIYTFTHTSDEDKIVGEFSVSSITEQGGKVTTISKDNGQVKITSPTGVVTRLQFDECPRDLKTCDFQQCGSAQTYEVCHPVLTKVILPDGGTYQMTYGEYDSFQIELTKFTRPNGHSTLIEYDGSGKGRFLKDTSPTEKTLSITHQTTEPISQYMSPGNTWQSKVVGFRGEETTYSSDFYRTIIKGPNNTITEIEGAPYSNVKKYSLPDGSQMNIGRVSDEIHYTKSRLQSLEFKLPSGQSSSMYVAKSVEGNLTSPVDFNRVTYKYNYNGLGEFNHTYEREDRKLTIKTPLNRITELRNNELGLLSSFRKGTTDPLLYSYEDGNLTRIEQGERTIKLEYDDSRKITSFIDGLNNKTEFTYDSSGRVSSKTLPDGRKLNFTYNSEGSIKKIVTPGSTDYLFKYNRKGYLRREIEPSVGENTDTTIYRYYPDGLFKKRISPDGSEIKRTLNPSGNIKFLRTSSGTHKYKYTDKGQIKSITRDVPSEIKLDFEWDGPVLKRVEWRNQGSVSYSYNELFLPSQVKVKAGGKSKALNNIFDNDGNLISSSRLKLTYLDDTNRVKKIRVGSTRVKNFYNSYGDISRRILRSGDVKIIEWKYDYDNNGRISKLTTTDRDGTSSVKAFTYDLAGRLIGQNSTTYAYDLEDNLLLGQAKFDVQNRLIENKSHVYTYSKNGEVTSKTHKSTGLKTLYEYDPMGSLLSFVNEKGEKIEYGIDGEGRRVARTQGSMRQGFLYKDRINPIARTTYIDGKYTLDQVYQYGSKGHSPDYLYTVADKQHFLLVKDHLGSVRFVINADTGTVVQEMDYDPWGNIIKDTNPGFQPFGYAGGVYDHVTGLVRFGVRDYDPSIGRWTSKDPIRFDSGQFNHYSYVNNDPINLIDPTGEILIIPALGVGAVGAIIGGIGGYLNSGACNPPGLVGDVLTGALIGFGSGILSFVSAGGGSAITAAATGWGTTTIRGALAGALGGSLAGLGPHAIDMNAPGGACPCED